MATKNSIDALITQIESGKLTNDAGRILSYILTLDSYKGNPTSIEISNLTGILHRTVTARLIDLLDLGLIDYAGTQTQRGKNRSTYKYISNPADRIRLSRRRENERYISAIKRMKKYAHLNSILLNTSLDHNLDKAIINLQNN